MKPNSISNRLATAAAIALLALPALFVRSGLAQCPSPPTAPSFPPFTPEPTPYCFNVGDAGCLACVKFCKRTYIDALGIKHVEVIVTEMTYENGCSTLSPDSVIREATDSLLVFEGESNGGSEIANCVDPATLVSVFSSMCWVQELDTADTWPLPKTQFNYWYCGSSSYCEHVCSVCYDTTTREYEFNNCFYNCLGTLGGCQELPPREPPGRLASAIKWGAHASRLQSVLGLVRSLFRRGIRYDNCHGADFLGSNT